MGSALLFYILVCILYSISFSSYVRKGHLNRVNVPGYYGIILKELALENIAITLEYLLYAVIGDTLMVAPVVERQVRSRKVYLPRGLWQDMNDENKEYKGLQWIHYNVDIRTVPYFLLKM